MSDNWRDRTLNEIARIESEIAPIEAHLKQLKAERTRLKRVLYDGRTDELRGHDNLLVLMGDIRPFIKQWIELYDRQHGGQGGQLMLSVRSTVSTRLIRKIVNGTNNGQRFVTLQTADRLLQAANMSHRISDLDIIANGSVRAVPPEPPQSQYYEE